MKNKVYAISKCCNAYTQSFPRTIEEILHHIPEEFICCSCKQFCEIEFKSAFQEISKGIYRKINYNL